MWKVPHDTEALGNRYTQHRDPHRHPVPDPASGSLLNPHAFSLSLTQAVEADRGARGGAQHSRSAGGRASSPRKPVLPCEEEEMGRARHYCQGHHDLHVTSQVPLSVFAPSIFLCMLRA